VRAAHAAGLLECVVVDNSSSDHSVSYIQSEYPWVKVIEIDENVGFGRACNRGIEVSDTPYILLLNPDASLSCEAVRHLVDFMDQHPRARICGPAVIEPSGALQTAGGLPTPWKILLKPLWPRWAARGQRRVVPGEAPFKTDWICGSILILRKSLIEEIGGFDPRFFLYFDETDLCYRALQMGWEIWAVGESVGKHVNAAAARATNKRMMGDVIAEHYFESRFYYVVKHYGWPAAAMAELGEIALMALRAAGERIRGKSYGNLAFRLRSPMLRQPPAGHGAENKRKSCPKR
jgi:GT2 family glycosyltransferase